MKKLLILISLGLLSSCYEDTERNGKLHSNHPEDSLNELKMGILLPVLQEPSSSALLDQARFKDEKFTTKKHIDSSGYHYFIASEHFEISIQYDKTGKVEWESVLDLKLNLLERKEYYSHGRLKKEKVVIKDSYDPIGIENQYAESGQLIRRINYDKKLKVPYHRALQTAQANGFILPDIEVDLVDEHGRKLWRIFHTKNKQVGNQMVLAGIDINAMTGQVKKSPLEKVVLVCN